MKKKNQWIVPLIAGVVILIAWISWVYYRNSQGQGAKALKALSSAVGASESGVKEYFTFLGRTLFLNFGGSVRSLGQSTRSLVFNKMGVNLIIYGICFLVYLVLSFAGKPRKGKKRGNMTLPLLLANIALFAVGYFAEVQNEVLLVIISLQAVSFFWFTAAVSGLGLLKSLLMMLLILNIGFIEVFTGQKGLYSFLMPGLGRLDSNAFLAASYIRLFTSVLFGILVYYREMSRGSLR